MISMIDLLREQDAVHILEMLHKQETKSALTIRTTLEYVIAYINGK